MLKYPEGKATYKKQNKTKKRSELSTPEWWSVDVLSALGPILDSFNFNILSSWNKQMNTKIEPE